MKAMDLVAAGEKAGLKFSKSLVYTVRFGHRKAAGPVAAPRKAGGREKRRGASDFIRSQPLTMSANDAVEAGKRAGLTFTRNLVYLVRGPRNVAPVASSMTASERPSLSKASTPEIEELARLILVIGLDRAETVLQRLRAALG